MTDNKLFIEYTNFLKHEKKVKFADQAEKLGVTRSVFDSYRINRVLVPSLILRKLKESFPELKDYHNDTTLSNNYSEIIDVMKKTIAAQEKVIESMERELITLNKEIEKLKSKDHL